MSLKLALYRQKEKLKRSFLRAKNGSCTVLLYHRIVDTMFDPQGLCVSPDNFNAQLTSLRKHHVFLGMDEFCNIMSSGKPFPKKALLITFDDGYADNFRNALPILEAHGLKAMFYIATRNLDADAIFWWDELDLLFRKVKENAIDLSLLKKEHHVVNDSQLYEFYLTHCKTAPSLDRRESLMNELRALIGLILNKQIGYEFLTTNQLKQLHTSKSADIGAHTMNHLSLGHLSLDDQYYEISESIYKLNSVLPSNIKHFSFPYGERTNFNEHTIRICKDLKMESAAANYSGYVSNETDLFSFPRFAVRNDGPDSLKSKLKEIL